MDVHFLTAAEARKLRDIARRVGAGGTSQRPVARRRRNPGGGGGGQKASVTQVAMLLKSLQPATYSYTAGPPLVAEVEPSALATEAIIELVFEEEGPAAPLVGKKDPETEEVKKLDAVNISWPTDIYATTSRLMLVEGYVRSYLVDGPEGEERKLYFAVTAPLNPLTMVRGTTTAAVTGAAWTMQNVVTLWGRPVSGTIGPVANPSAWTSDAGAYALAMQLPDGSWRGLDLQCKA